MTVIVFLHSCQKLKSVNKDPSMKKIKVSLNGKEKVPGLKQRYFRTADQSYCVFPLKWLQIACFDNELLHGDYLCHRLQVQENEEVHVVGAEARSEGESSTDDERFR